MYTIKYLCKRFGLSRSTLLYYDSIGLLKAAKRTEANYRIYSEEDVKRLEEICTYRKAGMTLEEIALIMNASDDTLKDVLQRKLEELNKEIDNIRNKQKVLIRLLKDEKLLIRMKIIDRNTLMDMLEAMGMDDENMIKLHSLLEECNSEAHHSFLEALGLNEEEIKEVVDCCRKS